MQMQIHFVLTLFLTSYAQHDRVRNNKQLFYTPLNRIHTPFHSYQTNPLLNQHLINYPQTSRVLYTGTGQPIYDFWSQLGHGHQQIHYPFQNVQLIPLNMLHPVNHQQSLNTDQLPVSNHNKQHASEDDTVVVAANNGHHSSKVDQPQSDHANIITPLHHLVKSTEQKKGSPLGFQRGHVEFISPHKELEYQAQLNKINWGGFQRGHVERAPSAFPEDVLRVSMHEPTPPAHGFDRGAVESIPDRSISGLSLTRASGAKVVCYFANWAWYRQGKAQYLPENVDPNLCTHVIYAFATYDKRSMQLKVSDPVVDDDNQFIERVAYLKKKNPSLKVLIAIGGWTDSGDNKYSFLASTYSNRRNFARESLQFLKRYNLDGISIDWHYPVCWQSDCTKGPRTDKQNFVELAKELHSMYSNDGYLVVASLSGYKEVIDVAYDVPNLSKNLDFMNIMTYDYHGSWESRTGHLSPLYEGPPSEDLKPTYNSNFTMEYYVTMGADRDKLVMGIPFYGQSFTLENKFDQSLGSLAVGPGNPGDHTQQAGMLAYYEICKLVRESGWTVRRDTSGSWGPYAYKDNQWVGYDDMDSIRRKARHVATNNFGGIFAFTLDLDDFNNDCCNGAQPLLRTISKELLGIPFSFSRDDCAKPPDVVTPFPPGALPEPTTTQPTIIRPTPSRPARPTNPVSQEECTYSTKPHTQDCNAYYTCNSNMETMHRCPFGLHWNKNIQSCDWPESAGCQQNPSAPTTQPPPLIIPIAPTKNPDSISSGARYCVTGDYEEGPACDQYYLCSNGMKQLQRCGPGLHWSQEMKLCDWPQPGKCKARSEDEMPKFDGPCQEGAFSGSKTSCDTYYVCVHGERMEFHCQGGLYWNDEVKICDWPNSARCKVNEPDTVVISPITSSSTPGPSIPSFTEPSPTSPSTTMAPSSPSTTMVTATEQLEVVRPPSSDLSGDFMLVCYFTNWAWYRPGMGKFKPENINPDLCTHIVYGFAVLDYEQLIIKPHDSWADIDNRFYEQVVELKRKGKKVTIAIGGWNDSAGDKYSRLVNNAAARSKFVRHVVEFIRKYNFDGLDLDWEYPKCWQTECKQGPESDKPNFAIFLRELHEAFRPHGLLLSSAVSPSKTIIDAGYDVPALSRYLDWIAVMTYDFHGQWDKKTGHVAPLYFHEEDDIFFFNANYSINYWIQQGADRKKIVMGVPLYGQSFTLVNSNEHGLNAPTSGGGTAGEYTRASGFLAYYEICQNIQRNGWTVVHDETGAMGPYAYKGNQWVSFDDVAMIRKKAELIREMNLGGGMVWALDLDDFSNSCGQGRSPLLTTLRSVLGTTRNAVVKVNEHTSSKPSKIVTTMKPAQPETESTTKRFVPIRNEEVEHCDEQFKPHEQDCNKYYQCIFGRYMVQSCPNGLVWNKNHCDWPRASSCQPGQPPLAERPKPTTTPRPQRPVSQEPIATNAPILLPQSTMSPVLPAEESWMTTYRPPKFTTTAAPTKSPEWCKQNWCPTPKPLPPNKYDPVNVPPSNYKVVCYFTNWAWYRPGAGKYKPEDINFNLCTHIAYGFAVLNPTTMVIRPHDGWADIDNQFYKQVTKLKERGVKVVLALGGWNDSLGDKYSKMANDPQARRRFINHAIEFIETWDFDGLDLDWEYPKCWQVDCDKGPASDKQAFASLVRELKEAFEPRGLLLSAAVSPNKKVVDEGYDVPTVSKYLDWIAVMTYDYHGQWDKKTGHNAPMFLHSESDNPYFNANYSINYWIDQGADRKKIVMGMPMYGQSFTLKDPKNTGLNSNSSGGAQAGEFTRSAGFLSYYEICNYVQKRGWTVVQDDTRAIGPYAYKGNQWVSFDDVDQIRRKSEYIKQMGLGGGMIWALDLDDFNGVCGCEKYPLLKTINRVLRSWPEPDPNCQLRIQ